MTRLKATKYLFRTRRAKLSVGLGAGVVLCAGLFFLSAAPVTPSAKPLPLIKPVTARAVPAVMVLDPEAGLSSTELMQRWEPHIAKAAKRFNVPADWIRNVMRAESAGHTLLGGKPIMSDKGAMGLMQVLPETYAEMASENRLGKNPFDPQDNIYAGTAYLRWLHGKYGYPAMFAAYNAGPGSLEDHLLHGSALPQETRLYVAGITKALGKGTEWLTAMNQSATQISLTAPDGHVIALDRAKISSVRAALPGEYGPNVAAVISMGRLNQGVRESASSVTALLGAKGI